MMRAKTDIDGVMLLCRCKDPDFMTDLVNVICGRCKGGFKRERRREIIAQMRKIYFKNTRDKTKIKDKYIP